MPTLNPRLTITLKPQLSAQLRRLSELTGNSQSALIAEMLEGSSGAFDKFIRVLEAARDAKESMRGHIPAELELAHQRIEQQLGLDLGSSGDGGRPVLDVGEKINRRSAPGASTPISNRGVRSDENAIKSVAPEPEPPMPRALKRRMKFRGGR